MITRVRLSSDKIVLVLACAFLMVLGLLVIDDLHLYMPDSTRYLVWSKSLASFEGFRDATSPDPRRYVIHAPLYPFLLAPAAFVWPLSAEVAKILTLCFGIVVLLLFYRWLSKHVSSLVAAAGTVLLAAHPIVLLYSTAVLSEIPFILFLLLSFVLLERYHESEESSPLLLAGIAASVTAVVLLRDIGYSLVVAAVVVLLLRRRFRAALVVGTVPIIFHALWLYRNEIVVGGREAPALTNAKLLVNHFYTSPDASLVQEFVARFITHLRSYLDTLDRIPFFPVPSPFAGSLMSSTDPSILTLSAIVQILRVPVAIISGIAAIYGLTILWKRSMTGKLVGLFLLVYLPIVLIYPISDSRFLFPLIVITIGLVVVGAGTYLRRVVERDPTKRHLVGGVVLASIMMILIPNSIWNFSVAAHSLSYRSIQGSSEEQSSISTLPTHYRRPFRLAGEWLQANTPLDAVFVCRWMDLVVWIGDRKILSPDALIPVDKLEYRIRDYGAEYLITVKGHNGLRDYELQMALSRRYGFQKVQEFGDIQILRILPRGEISQEVPADNPLQVGVQLLSQARYAEAGALFDSLGRSTGFDALYLAAMAKEFSGRFHDAREMFKRFREYEQTGSFLDEARVHLELINLLEQAARPGQNSLARAELYFQAALGYRNLGYHVPYRMAMSRAIASDTAFLPAYMIGFVYALDDGDTITAREYFHRLRQATPDGTLNADFARILALQDSIHASRMSRVRTNHFFALGEVYARLDLPDHAIDQLLISLQIEPNNTGAAFLLAYLYAHEKKQYSLARDLLISILEKSPGHVRARQELERIAIYF